MSHEPCKYALPLLPKEKQAMGLGPVKRWTLCLQDPPPLKRVLVCPCQGCGPKCPGYKPEEE